MGQTQGDQTFSTLSGGARPQAEMLVPPSPIIKQIAQDHNIMSGNIIRKHSRKKMSASKKEAMQN